MPPRKKEPQAALGQDRYQKEQIRKRNSNDPQHLLAGVYAAAVTHSLLGKNGDSSPDLESVPALLHFLAARGCHGVVLFGTTGEDLRSPRASGGCYAGGSASRSDPPDLRLIAGTGTPSLSETIELTRLTFDLGYEAALVVPPCISAMRPMMGCSAGSAS